MEKKQAITLKIAGKSYPLTIDREKEEVYRLAEREVNAYLGRVKLQHVKGWNDADYIAIAALNFAISNVNMRRSREVEDEDLKRLQQLDNELEHYLDGNK